MPSESENDEKTETKGTNNRLLQLPLARIKTITKSSPDLGNVSQEAYFLITRATECFVQYMAIKAWEADGDKKTVEYKQLANLVESDESLEFLEEIVPQKIKVADYWKAIGYTQPPNSPPENPKKSPSKSLNESVTSSKVTEAIVID